MADARKTKAPPLSKEAQKRHAKKKDASDFAYLNQISGQKSIFDRIFITRFACWVFRSLKGLTQSQGKSKGGKPFKMPTVSEATEYVKNNQVMVMITVGLVAMIVLMAGAEDFNAGSANRTQVEENYYEVMGIARDASVIDIKKAYKKLAMRYHPDKNPNCTVCEEKFSLIAQANNILMDPEKRKVYDKSGSIEKRDDMSKSQSIELTAENFEDLVMRSSDVWLINVYHPDEGFSAQIHPFWESLAQDEQAHARFGRIDAVKNKEAIKFLPIQPRMYPTVLRIARGNVPEIFPIYEADANGLPRFFLTYYPKSFPTTGDSELKSWLARDSDKHKVLLIGSEPKGKKSLLRRKIAYQWQDVAVFRHASADSYKRIVGSDALAEKGDRLMFFPAKGADISKPLMHIAAPKKGDEWAKVLLEATQSFAPFLTTRNYEPLCRSTNDIRNYCLILVDADTGKDGTYEVEKVTGQLASSMTAYKEELREIEAAGSELSEAEEQFNIQLVRVSTAGQTWSLLPQPTVGYNAPFHALSAALGGSPKALLVDIDTKRVAAWTKPSFAELYQNIAYGDLTLQEMEDNFQFSRAVPNLEESAGQHARRIMRSASWLHRGGILLGAATVVEVWANVLMAGYLPGVIAASVGTVALSVVVSPPVCAEVLSYVPGFLLPG